MDGLFGFLEFTLAMIVVLIGMTFAFTAYASKLPANNPLRQVVGAFSKRVAATTALAVVGVPVVAIPVIGEVGDLIGLVAVVFYWISFFRELRGTGAPPPPIPAAANSGQSAAHNEAPAEPRASMPELVLNSRRKFL